MVRGGPFSIRIGWEGDAFVKKMGGSGSFFLKIGWEWVVLVEGWVEVCRFYQKMGGNGSFFLKNGWEWVVFLEKLMGVGESGWQ